MAALIDLVIREARPDDYEAVLAINENIYDGMDYVPSRYFTYIRDSLAFPFVAEVRGELVAFRVMYVVDAETKIVSISKRTTSKYQGKGIQREIKKKCVKILIKRHRNIQTLSYTDLSVGELESRRDTAIIQRHWNYMPFKTSGETLKSSETLRNPSVIVGNVSHLSRMECSHLAYDENVRDNVITEERFWIPIEWIPLSKSTRNLTQLVNEAHICGTEANDEDGNETWSDISYGATYRVPKGMVYDMCFHCRTTENLLAHIVKQLQRVATFVKASTNVSFVLCYPKSLDNDKVLEFLEPDFGAPYPISPELPCYDCMIVEEDMKVHF